MNTSAPMLHLSSLILPPLSFPPSLPPALGRTYNGPNMAVIEIKGLSKSYQVYQKREGLAAAIGGLFHRQYRLVEAVRGVVGLVGADGFLKKYTLDARLQNGVLPGNIWFGGKYVPAPAGWQDTTRCWRWNGMRRARSSKRRIYTAFIRWDSGVKPSLASLRFRGSHSRAASAAP